jgi:hypothetical protein
MTGGVRLFEKAGIFIMRSGKPLFSSSCSEIILKPLSGISGKIKDIAF